MVPPASTTTFVQRIFVRFSSRKFGSPILSFPRPPLSLFLPTRSKPESEEFGTTPPQPAIVAGGRFSRIGIVCGVHSDLLRHPAVLPPHRVTTDWQTADRQRIVLPEDNSVRSCLDYSRWLFQGKQFLPPGATAVERSDTGASAEKVSA